jgi:hypothetical protein
VVVGLCCTLLIILRTNANVISLFQAITKLLTGTVSDVMQDETVSVVSEQHTPQAIMRSSAWQCCRHSCVKRFTRYLVLALCDPAGIPAVAALHRGGGGRRPAAEGGRPGALAVHQVRARAGRHQVTEYPCGVNCHEISNSPLHLLMCALEKCVLFRCAHRFAFLFSFGRVLTVLVCGVTG